MKHSSLHYKLTRVHCTATVDRTVESKETLLGLITTVGYTARPCGVPCM